MNEQTRPDPQSDATVEPPEILAPEDASVPAVELATEPEQAPEAAQGLESEQTAGPDQAAELVPPPELGQVKRVLEAALLSSSEPLTLQQLKRLFAGEVAADNIRKVLDELKEDWAARTLELTSVSSGWRFRVKPEFQEFLDRISSEKPPRYSRAVLETLAIIAYRQPVTRGDIEDVRGVAVAPATLNALLERGWVEVIGQRETPGRPAIFATTKKFLDDLNLRSIEELPPLEELQSALASAPATLVDAPPPAPEQQILIDEPPPPESTESEDHAG